MPHPTEEWAGLLSKFKDIPDLIIGDKDSKISILNILTIGRRL